MNSPESQEIIARFFEALDYLIENKTIRGRKTFATIYQIDYRNFLRTHKNPASQSFQMAWLKYMVEDFGISAEWLLTGSGTIIRPKNRGSLGANREG